MSRSSYKPRAYFSSIILFLLFFLVSLTFVNSIHVQGIWSPSSTLFKVITRFGFQRTDPNHRLETSGYIFGNITLLNHQSNRIFTSSNNNSENHQQSKQNPIYNSGVLLFANRTLFKHIYNIYLKTKNIQPNCNQTSNDLGSKFCSDIFNVIQPKNSRKKICHNSTSNDNDDDDNEYFRYIPCPINGTCDNQCQNLNIPNYQLAFMIDGQKDASFWYLILLPCKRKYQKNQTSFQWTMETNEKILLSYNLWIVNGHPDNRISSARLIDSDYQFSYEQQNFWFFILLDLGYIILIIMQIYALTGQKMMKNLNYLFTISLLLHSLSYFFICLHKIVFAENGEGFETLFTIAEVLKIMSIALLMLFVLIIAKGWPFTKPETFSKTILLIMATIYIVINILLFIWMKQSLNMIEEVDEFHTAPGWISIGFRIILMLWFIYELRHTMMLEQDSRRLKFYLHFGAGMLVWFVHLPLVAIVAIHIDLMWRCKIITGFSATADFLAFAILTRIMWTTNNKQFLIPDTDIYNEELEYYSDDNCSYIQQQQQQQQHDETFKFSNANFKHSSKHFQYDNHHNVCDNTIPITTLPSTITTTITSSPITSSPIIRT
ncbi:uncharacterized protein LOC113795549 [Dermatophagoides pteronyssinus]|uniref:uncharacterized protein LOC113795549 n=1 Tax=Dermatophagoides pteronyssinus TaxID=6956 RepID=UPI003F67E7EC